MITETVFQSRATPAPSTRAPGSEAVNSRSNSSRHLSRASSAPSRIAASHSSRAATIASTPATFSVPARRPSSCGPPRSSGGKFAGHFKKPTPCGPPNLCAQPLTKSHAPSPAAGIRPIHCAASQKNFTPCSRHTARVSRQGCSTPVSLFAAISATRCGVRSEKSGSATTPVAADGRRRAGFPRTDSITHGCSIADTATSSNCAITAFADSVAPLVKTISSAPHPSSTASRLRAFCNAASARCPALCGDDGFAGNFSTASSHARFAVSESGCVALWSK